MRSVEELEQTLYESELESEGLAESLAGSKVVDLTELVSKTGKMRGHLTGVTPKQYRKFLGSEAPPDLLKKARDATTRKVQWDMVLDQIATERGYRSDEELRDAIEQAHEDRKTLDRTKAEQKYLRNEIIEKLRADPDVETIKLDDVCPQFPSSVCVAEVTMVNGREFRLRRQHSYWRIDTADGKSLRIRYAKDARKLARLATRGYKQEIKQARVVRLKKKLIPKRRRRPTLTSMRSIRR